MQTLHLKPAEGFTILNPDNNYRPLRAEGEIVPASTYWRRRLAEGGVVEVTESEPAPPPARPKQKA
jgi:hypothetical protein